MPKATDLAKRFQRIARLKDPSLAFTDLAAEFVDPVGNATRTAIESIPFLLAILDRPEQIPHTADALHMLAGAASLDPNIRREVDAARPLYRRWAKQGSQDVRAAALRLLPRKPVSAIKRLQQSDGFSDACLCALAVLRQVTNDQRRWTGGGCVSTKARLNGVTLDDGFWMETNPQAEEILAEMAELAQRYDRERPDFERGLEFGDRLHRLQKKLYAYPPEAEVRKQYRFHVPRGPKPQWQLPLTAPQKQALRTLAACDPLWRGDTNLWAAFGLPSRRDRLLKLLHSSA
jgi:hypothetical protein